MLQSRIGRAVAGLALTVAAAGLAGCGAQDGAADAEALASLTKQVKEQKRLTEALVTRLDRIERRLDGQSEDLDHLGRQRVAAELATADVAEPGGEDEAAAATTVASSGDSVDVAALLQTEDGRAAVEQALVAIQEKRDAERRERWVGSLVDRFVEQANLSTAQAEDMRRIVGASFKKVGEVWSGIQGGGDMTPEERSAAREEAMIKMEEIRLATNDEVKGILSADQYAIYEEQAARMRGFGGGRGGGSRGGGGR